MSEDKIRPGASTGHYQNCVVCGDEFYVPSWRIAQAEKRKSAILCCSQECSGVNKRGVSVGPTGADHPNWRGGTTLWHRKYEQDHARRYPERERARAKASEAKAAGELVQSPCEVCGSTVNIEMHHDDYSKPLDIRWLCRTHHRMLHLRPVDFRREATVYMMQKNRAA